MTPPLRLAASALLLTLLWAGCASTEEAVSERGERRRYGQAYQSLIEQAAETLRDLGMEVEEARELGPDEYLLIGRRANAYARSASGSGSGNAVLTTLHVNVRRAGERQTEVHVEVPSANMNYGATAPARQQALFFQALERRAGAPVER